MLKFSIYYPCSDNTQFDMDYYLKKHLPLVQSELKDVGLEKLEVVLGQPGAMNKHPHFIAVANLYFENAETMGAALRTKGGILVSDIKNFTNIEALQEVSTIWLP